jgi:hypothetical protein
VITWIPIVLALVAIGLALWSLRLATRARQLAERAMAELILERPARLSDAIRTMVGDAASAHLRTRRRP